MSTRNYLLFALTIVIAGVLGGLVVWFFVSPQPTRPPVSPPVATDTPTPTPVPEPELTVVRAYLVRAEKLGVAGRTVEASDDAAAVAKAAVEALVTDPTREEEGWGLGTAIPPGVSVHDVTIVGDVATADLSNEFASGGGSLSMQLRAAQLVFTLTQFEGIERVSLMIDGKPVRSLGGEGVDVDAVTRADFEDVLPPVLVEMPFAGETVGDPLLVSGTSNVFEATHQLQVTDSAGTLVYDHFITATSGTGTRGTWSQPIDVTKAAPGAATVTVFEYSAESGAKINEVEIPIQIQ